MASLRLSLFGAESDVPPVAVEVAMPPRVQGMAYNPDVVGQLAEAFNALVMLSRFAPPSDDPDGVVAYYAARLDVLTERAP